MKNSKIPAVKSFKTSVDFFYTDEAKILKGKHGALGLLVYNVLMCEIWRSGYYIEWNIATRFRIIDLVPGLSVDMLEDILCTLMQIGIIDQKTFEDNSVFTSAEIQREYFKARKPKPGIEYPHMLIDLVIKPMPNHPKDASAADEFKEEQPVENKVFNHKATPWAPRLVDIQTSLNRKNIKGINGESPVVARFHQYFTNRDWLLENGERVTSWKNAFKNFVDKIEGKINKSA